MIVVQGVFLPILEEKGLEGLRLRGEHLDSGFRGISLETKDQVSLAFILGSALRS